MMSSKASCKAMSFRGTIFVPLTSFQDKYAMMTSGMSLQRDQQVEFGELKDANQSLQVRRDEQTCRPVAFRKNWKPVGKQNNDA